MLEKISFVILDTKIDIFSNNSKFLRAIQDRYNSFYTPSTNKITENTLLWIVNIMESNKSDSDGLISLKFLRAIQERYDIIYTYPLNGSTDTSLWAVNIMESDKPDSNGSTLEIIEYGAKIKFKSYFDLINYFTNHLMKQLVGKTAGKYILVHAGAVCKNNRATIIVAPSYGGKTTLVLGLLRKGYKFLADDIAVIDFKSHQVLPFPRGLTIRADSPFVSALPNSVSEKLETEIIVDIQQINPNSLGNTSLLDNLIFLEGYSDTQNSPKISRIPSYKAVVNLCKYTWLDHKELQNQLERNISFIRHVNCYSLKTGDLERTLDLLCNALSGGGYD